MWNPPASIGGELSVLAEQIHYKRLNNLEEAIVRRNNSLLSHNMAPFGIWNKKHKKIGELNWASWIKYKSLYTLVFIFKFSLFITVHIMRNAFSFYMYSQYSDGKRLSLFLYHLLYKAHSWQISKNIISYDKITLSLFYRTPSAC